MFYTYILKSLSNNSYYIGSCKNIEERFNLHNKGKIRSTKRKIPWVIVCTEVYQTLLEARRREKQIKSWKSRKAVERLL